jgi:hypothetical protein
MLLPAWGDVNAAGAQLRSGTCATKMKRPPCTARRPFQRESGVRLLVVIGSVGLIDESVRLVNAPLCKTRLHF